MYSLLFSGDGIDCSSEIFLRAWLSNTGSKLYFFINSFGFYSIFVGIQD